jgi:hypothetical protein
MGLVISPMFHPLVPLPLNFAPGVTNLHFITAFIFSSIFISDLPLDWTQSKDDTYDVHRPLSVFNLPARFTISKNEHGSSFGSL